MRALWGLDGYSLNHLIDMETDYTKTCFLKFQYNNCFIIVWTVRRIVSFVLRTLVQYHVKLILSGYYPGICRNIPDTPSVALALRSLALPLHSIISARSSIFRGNSLSVAFATAEFRRKHARHCRSCCDGPLLPWTDIYRCLN